MEELSGWINETWPDKPERFCNLIQEKKERGCDIKR